MTDIDIIRDNVHELERLAQLAEEATELAQAALKLRRAYKSTGNPTPVTLQGAYQNLLEELADVKVCLAVLNLDANGTQWRVDQLAEEKLHRWAERLRPIEMEVPHV